jgi:hypothetical protein
MSPFSHVSDRLIPLLSDQPVVIHRPAAPPVMSGAFLLFSRYPTDEKRWAMKLKATRIEVKATEVSGKPAFVVPYRIAGNCHVHAVTDHGDQWLPLKTSWNGDGQVFEPVASPGPGMCVTSGSMR